MYIKTSRKFNKRIKVIQPGEYYVSEEDEMISTLLGSCVAVCLYDPVKGIAGMNHFMLPGRISESDVFSDRSARYGITAINNLINHIQKLGAKKDNLTAKIFGGGHILESERDIITIPSDNIRIAKLLIELEDIPIIETDVGNNYTRRLFMDVKSGKIHLKKTNRSSVLHEIAQRDREFAISRLRNNEQD